MDFSSLVGAGIGGLIALGAQVVVARVAGRVAQTSIDYDRWDAWRRDAADAWAGAASAARRFDDHFSELADLDEDDLEALECHASEVIHSLDRLSALTLDRRVSDWASQLAGLFGGLVAALPLHPGCDDEAAAKRYRDLRCLLHERFDWNDGDRSTQVERLRDALRQSIEPPERPRTRHGHRSRRVRSPMPAILAVDHPSG